MWSGAEDEKVAYAAFDVVVAAASAGGIEALLPFLRNLPVDFSAPVILVQHLPPASLYRSRLPEILQRSTSLRVKWAENGESLHPGTIYVAPQDRSTILDSKKVCLLVSEAKGLRAPAADPLFHSAVQLFGSRTIAVVLSGVLSDGAEGAAAIAKAGGRVLAQTAAEARFIDMPNAAMDRSCVGLAFDSASLATVISGLVMTPGVAGWFAIGKAGVGAQLFS